MNFSRFHIYGREPRPLESMVREDEAASLEENMSLLITCELGGKEIPPWLSFEDQRGLSDAQSDEPGRYVASQMASQLRAPLILNEYSPELIDVTRSLRHQQLFSKFTRGYSNEYRQRLVDQVYRPYRSRLESAVGDLLASGDSVIHLSVRSFKLRNQGKIRRTDVGLLYDPSRGDEVDLCLDWIDEMWERAPMLRVRRNYPHRGTSNGLTRMLRTAFAGQDYLGIEVWLNRAWAKREVAIRDTAISGICGSLQAILEQDTDSQARAA